MKHVKRLLAFLLILLFLVGWGIFLFFVGPVTIVNWIGVEQGYLVAFLVAAFGGVSALTATSYFTTIITLALGGLNPLLLGLLGGLGVTIGDTIFFFLGINGRFLLLEFWEKRVEAFSAWLKRRPGWFVPLLIYLYAGFSPFPNEFMTISAGLAGVRYRRILPPLLLGNITITILLAWLAIHGVRLLG